MNSPEKLQKPEIGVVPYFLNTKINPADWRDGLVLRSPNWLGDAAMTLPAVQQLRKVLPRECGLFVVCPPGLLDFYRAMPIIDLAVALHQAHKLWTFDDIARVRSLHAGAAMLFNNSLRDALYFRIAGVPKLFGAAARCRGFLMTRTFKFPKRRSFELNNFHHAAKYLSMAYAVGAPDWDGSLPEFKVSKEPELMDKEFLELMKHDHILAISPGAAYGESKCWPSEFFNQVARYWIDEKGGIAVAVGAGKEHKMCENALLGLPEGRAFNMAGKTGLQELIMLLQKADFCVANDSGTMHLSAAVGGRGAAIFGSTDPSATSPVSSKWTMLFEKEDCAPCFKRECLKKESRYKCLRKIAPEKVINIIQNSF